MESMNKPKTRDGYTPAQFERVKAAVLALATVLGDLLDEMVVVGGFVPSLLIVGEAARDDPHVGTTDLDLGLELALLGTGGYRTLPERLRARDFQPDHNEQGNVTRQRWCHASGVTVDFLMAPVDAQK